ncbi:MAG: Holliday junction branch migration DNA helicase RuvB [Candidatus Marinimicrobia bacterium]|nr:Holliday junction branch migration DNA helicase RuvB [Candidatus Neomarinimicrobiota bacterium]|tara:strand:+ start:107885 stop:108895 length:1011 start_codon:yes stop_codon:yes gene_type:complete
MIKSSSSNKDITTPDKLDEDVTNEKSLRPSRFSDFIGQKKEVEKLKVYIKAAKKRSEALDHVILYGPPGLGKTTLANIIAKELDVNIKLTSGPILDRAGDLAGVLTNLEEHGVLFIDEIHRLNSVVEEYLYSAMEDYVIDIMLDKGPNARSVQLNLNPFTLVGATTKLGNLTSPMRDRFGVIIRLDFYSNEELCEIIKRSASLLNIDINERGCYEISRRSRGTPRIANRILKRTRDFADVKSNGKITEIIANEALEALAIDEYGLDQMDKNILQALIKNFNGGPVGLDSLGVVVSENPKTIEEVYEPYLIKEGFIQRTSRGRIALDKTFEYLKITK